MTDRFPKVLAACGLIAGSAAALFYYRQGLTLSHYDAKAHLVVARRVLDSLTPEYSQIGAVWLPLPHLLNLLPVQIDAFYRTGASGVAFSVLAFALACYAIAHLVLRITSSRSAAALSVAMFAADPDVLYLQSTPMTEPLLFGLTLLSISLVYDWVEVEAARGSPGGLPAEARDGASRARAKAGWVLVAACLTRYEAWFVTPALLFMAGVALWRTGRSLREVVTSLAHLAIYPVLAIVCFFFHSWFTIGEWFVTGGFFVPDNIAYAQPYTALMAVLYGMRILVGTPLMVIAPPGVAAVLWRGFMKPDRAPSLVVLALAGLMVLPLYAFYQGHPFRMRYMIAPSVGMMVFGGIAIGLLRRPWRYTAVAIVVIWMAVTVRPLDSQAPMVQEAQWDLPFSRGRRNVTKCLMREYQGERILASMGSLAHYMHETSHAGFNLRDYIHEGIGQVWTSSLEMGAKHHAGWVLIEEQAEGGDELARLRDAKPAFLDGFTRLCEGGGVALYKRRVGR